MATPRAKDSAGPDRFCDHVARHRRIFIRARACADNTRPVRWLVTALLLFYSARVYARSEDPISTPPRWTPRSPTITRTRPRTTMGTAHARMLNSRPCWHAMGHGSMSPPSGEFGFRPRRRWALDFAPYWTNGRWVFTDYGWTWESDWNWGWAPFHYGRWAMVQPRGWCWVPGTLWGPAWVAWRVGRTNVGWAPLPPQGMNLGRPLGTHSPWRFARSSSLGTRSLEPVPPREIPAIFGRSVSVSTPRQISVRGLAVRINAGPTGPKCCGNHGRPILSFQELAPNASPAIVIRPRRGAPLRSRPWVAAGAREQTPIVPWPRS